MRRPKPLVKQVRDPLRWRLDKQAPTPFQMQTVADLQEIRYKVGPPRLDWPDTSIFLFRKFGSGRGKKGSLIQWDCWIIREDRAEPLNRRMELPEEWKERE